MKADLLTKVEKAATNNAMDTLGFVCLETAIDVLGDLNEDPNVWVWEHPKSGMRVTMYDEGKDKCSFVAVVRQPILVEA